MTIRSTAGTLYVVATPIGNLDDITLRAVQVLKQVELVAAEDTRRTRILLTHLGIKKPIVSYYDAVESRRAPELVQRMLSGESIALVSDAGTPLISDPGYRLLREAIAKGVNVVPVPGPSAPLALLSAAGLATDRFSFIGFVPPRATERQRVFRELATRPDTLVFFETGRRLAATLAEMAEVLGPREAAIGRELTKRFEEIVRGGLDELAARYASRAGDAVRGEVVLAVAGAAGRGRGVMTGLEETLPAEVVKPDLDAMLRVRLAEGEPIAAVSRAIARATGLPRRAVYQRALELRAADPRDASSRS